MFTIYKEILQIRKRQFNFFFKWVKYLYHQLAKQDMKMATKHIKTYY